MVDIDGLALTPSSIKSARPKVNHQFYSLCIGSLKTRVSTTRIVHPSYAPRQYAVGDAHLTTGEQNGMSREVFLQVFYKFGL